jgi:serine phosphatase RsbU (regulator of sigma subunit)/HAMP domain-containing protein
MARSRPFKRSLANRYTLLVAVLVGLTTLILASALASGVYRMALGEESSRQRAQGELIVRDVSNRLQSSFRVLRTLASRDVIVGGDDRAVGKALASAYVDNAEYLRGIALYSFEGSPTVMYPQDQALPSDDVIRGSNLSEGVAYLWLEADDPTPASLWVLVPIQLSDGSESVLLGAVRTAFIDDVLKQVSFSEKSPTALIVDSAGTSVLTAGEYDPSGDDSGLGSVLVASAAGQRFRGVYADISGLTGLDWRVVVTEPDTIVAAETWQALRPAVFAWGASSVIALILALVSVAWLARPLRLLDERARAAASGAMLEPLPVTRSDEIGRLIESFNSVGQRLNRMHDMSQMLARSADLDQVLDLVLVSLGRILVVKDVGIMLLEDEGRTLWLARAAGTLAKSAGARIKTDSSRWLAEVVATREMAEFIGEVISDPVIMLRGADDTSLRALAVPLVKGETMLGVMVVMHGAEEAFSDAEAELARSFAAQASVALDNARLFAEERRSRRDAEALRHVAEIMGGADSRRDSLSLIAGIEAELLDADLSWVFLEGGSAMRGTAEEALAGSWLSLWRRLHAERSFADTSMPVALTDADTDPEVRSRLRGLGVRMVVISPITVSDSLAGLVVLGWSNRTYQLDKRANELTSAIGKQVALALQNAMLFDEARTRADNLETIFRISQAVSSSLQSKVVLNRVLDVVQKILSADAVMLMTLDVDRSLMIVPMARGILSPEMLQMEFRAGEDLPGEVFEHKEPVNVIDLADSASPLARLAASQDLGSAVFVPLLARGRSIGVLAVFSRDKNAFIPEEVELLRTFATQAALAIDTANLFSREHHVATVLQHSILPTRLPLIEGIESSSVYVPAGSEVEIGGDYYDLFLAPDGRVALAIGDVCGKGVEAATKTSMIKYSVRGMIAAGASPSDILAELNRALVAAGDPSDIVTVWLGLLDIGTGRLSWANGGHPPSMLLQPETGEIVRLGTTGALLGAINSAEYGESEVIVEPGNTILLYTDGVTEARSQGRFFGEGRVRRALRQGGSPAVVTQRLLASVQRFSHGDLRDDAAILTLMLKGPVEDQPRGVSVQ